MSGKRVVRTADFVAKIKAFVDTRRSSRFLLFARTDAIAVNGFEDAIDRGNRYLEAGADVVFIEAPTSYDQAAMIPKLIKGPVLYNWVYGGKSPLIPFAELSALGFDFCLQADVLYCVSYALRAYFEQLRTSGSYGTAAERMLTFDQFNDIVGLAAMTDADAKYSAD